MKRGLKLLAVFFAFVAIYAWSHHHAQATPAANTTTTTSPTSGTTTTTSPVNTASCQAQSLSGHYNEGSGAAGTIYASVTLTNTSPTTCTLRGWPLLTLQDKLGAVLKSTQLDEPASTNIFQFPSPSANLAPATLRLTSGESAQFALAYSDVSAGSGACESAVTVSVQLVTNGATVAVTPPYPVQPCNAGQLWVSPFYK